MKKQEDERAKQFLDPESNKFPYADLNGAFPKGVDPTRKELYLSEDDFATVFGMTSAQFTELKAWKKNDLKRAKGLF